QWAAKSSVKLESVERLTINELEAATGTARVNTNKGTRDLRMLAIRGGRDKIFRFAFLTEPKVTASMSVPLRKTTYSFRTLTESEKNTIKAPHIRLQTVRTGDNPEKLSAAMPLGKFNEAWFRALNLNALSDGLAAGEKVKVVAN
ncbi:MAG: hypothetical protein NWR87_00135, partial [Rhodospirillales bacterium]|nr:hypothetical protein [Rhodospirillales bacterium]